MEIKIKKSDLSINKIVEISSSPKILVYFDGTNYHAFSGICQHAKWPLELGKVSQLKLTCAGHGWEYDITNGECLSNPGRDLKSFRINEDGDNVLVSC